MNDYIKVRMRDLSITDSQLLHQLTEVFRSVLSHGILIQGEEVDGFEKDLASHLGTSSNQIVSCASASSGLYLALKALEIGPGDEVITTPLTWLVTGSAILQVGATPVFVDVDQDYNLDPDQVIKAINKNTKCILVVHYYGKLAQIEKLDAIARAYNLFLIEDSAQAFGTMLNNKFAGTFGDIGVYSFSPMKVIGGFGDAGALVVRNEEVAEKLRILRHCGTIDKEYCVSPESKHIMDAVHAALLRIILPQFERTIDKRRSLARLYTELLQSYVICPDLGIGNLHSAYDFPIRLKERDKLHDYLNSRGVESRIRHPLLVSDQVVHSQSIKHPMPNAELYVKTILCLPIHNNIVKHEIEFVSKVIIDFLRDI
jgi:dTDP-4-amino-4,6-dideoxygalactose transaminase